MADFSNHQRFTLRCLAEDLVPVSICPKQNIRTPKGLQIIRKAERALLNERVRSINNILNMLKSLRDTCREELRRVLSREWMARCEDFIEVGKEKHHFKTLNRQKDKFNRLLQQKHIKEDKHKGLHGGHIVYHSNASIQNNTNLIHVEDRENNNHNNNYNINNYNNRVQEKEREDTRKENIWVKNLSSTPLTKDQIKALAHGPNYAIVPRNPPLGDYIAAIENACNQLPQGKAEELRGEIKSVMKRIHPPRSNITRGKKEKP